MNYTYNGVTAGEGCPSIVLVHGAGGSHLDWPIPWRTISNAFQAETKSMPGQGGQVLQHFPVYALDLPGHGESKKAGECTIEEYGHQVSEFLCIHNLKNVCLIGHSMGVAVTLSAFLHKADRIGSLVLIAGAAEMDVSSDLLSGLRDHPQSTVAAIARACWHKTTPPMFRETARRRMMMAGPNTLLGDFSACAAVDLYEQLNRVSVPALILAAKEDRMISHDRVQDTADALPGGRLVSFEKCGHFLQIERSEEAAQQIAKFLSN